jgi:hypothetical protein
MAIVNIIRSGGNDLYDLDIYLRSPQHPTETETSATTSTPAAASVSSNISAEDGEVGDINILNLNIEEAQHISAVTDTSGELLFNQKALQKYILHCGQNVEGGGLRGTNNNTYYAYMHGVHLSCEIKT